MHDILQSIFPGFVLDYVYPPFIFVTWGIVEWLRYQFHNLEEKIKPKHIAMIVGVIVGIGCYLFEVQSEGVIVEPKTLMVSYFVLTVTYEYAIRPIKEKLLPLLPWFKKQNNEKPS